MFDADLFTARGELARVISTSATEAHFANVRELLATHQWNAKRRLRSLCQRGNSYGLVGKGAPQRMPVNARREAPEARGQASRSLSASAQSALGDEVQKPRD